jgi:hypothetical protein
VEGASVEIECYQGTEAGADFVQGKRAEGSGMRTLAGAVLGAAGAALIAAGCSGGPAAARTGTVQGRLLAYPGPMPANGKPPANPMAGMAAFTDTSGHTVSVTVDPSGRFTIHLAAGSYTALLAPASLTPVRENIRVQASKTLTITVLCSEDSGTCGQVT